MLLTQEQEDTLYNLVMADDIAKAAAVSGNDQLACDRVNLPAVVVHRRVSQAILLRWSAMTGAMRKLQHEAQNGTNGKRDIAISSLAMLGSAVGDLVLDSEIVGMIDKLVAGNVFTMEDKADLFNRCAELISNAENEIGRKATIEDIGIVMARDRPDGKIPKVSVINADNWIH